MPQPIAKWNESRDCWESGQADLLSGLSDVFSETWPRSGMTRDGTAFEPPTSEPRTDGSASSSLLPTPTVQDGANTGGPSQFERNSLPLNTAVLCFPPPPPATPTEPEATETAAQISEPQ